MRATLRRNQKGSGIIEGTVGLMLVIGGSVMGALLVLNSGAGIFFKVKEAYLTNLAAQYACQHLNDSALQSEVTNYVQALMPNLGLAPNNLQVTATPATVVANGQSQTGVSVTVANQFPIFGNGTLLPCQLKMSDTEFAAGSSVGGNGGGLKGYANVTVYGGTGWGIVGQPFNNPMPANLYVPIYQFPGADATGKAPDGMPTVQQQLVVEH